MSQEKILVIGASGQIGTELVLQLREQYGSDAVVSADIKTPHYEIFEGGPYEILDILDSNRLHYIIGKHRITHVYNLAALLSSTAEQNPEFGWNLNMKGLLNTLELAKEKLIKRLFWPSSIAVFGPNTPKENTPLTMIHWDNFGFDAPENYTSSNVVHNYTNGILGTATPRPRTIPHFFFRGWPCQPEWIWQNRPMPPSRRYRPLQTVIFYLPWSQ